MGEGGYQSAVVTSQLYPVEPFVHTFVYPKDIKSFFAIDARPPIPQKITIGAVKKRIDKLRTRIEKEIKNFKIKHSIIVGDDIDGRTISIIILVNDYFFDDSPSLSGSNSSALEVRLEVSFIVQCAWTKPWLVNLFSASSPALRTSRKTTLDCFAISLISSLEANPSRSFR